MKKLYPVYLTAILLFFTISACEKSVEPKPISDQELITTVTLNLYDSANTSNKISVTWKDLDGEGGKSPVIDTLKLKSNVTYLGKIVLKDDTKIPPQDISIEVEKEKNQHQFFFKSNSELNNLLGIMVNDYDTNIPPLPVGLEFKLIVGKTNETKKGLLNIFLSHYEGVKIVAPSPETDVNVDFPIQIQ